MADDKSNRGVDRSRINMQEDHKVRYWAREFGVTKEEFKRALDKVGPCASAIEQEILHSNIGKLGTVLPD